MKRLSIIGAGPGDPRLLTAQAAEALRDAPRGLTTARIGERLAAINPCVETTDLSGIRAILAQNDSTDIAVAVSGDTGFYSLSASLAREFAGRYDLRVISGISSLQYFCAALAMPYDDALCISLHGRAGGLLGPVSYHHKVFALTDASSAPQIIAAQLRDAGMHHLTIHAGERLSEPDQRIVSGSPEDIAALHFAAPAVVLIVNPSPANPHRRLRDSDFIRAKVPMTKEHLRNLSVARLEIQPEDTIYDIGAGTGSVSVAMAMRASRGTVFAVERNPDALRLIGENHAALGAYNVQIVAGEAPDSLEGLPDPDKVFIGGSGGEMAAVVEQLLARRKPFLLCINTVTLESLCSAKHLLEQHGFEDVEIEDIHLSSAHSVGSYHMMKAENAVFILSGRSPAPDGDGA